MYVHYVCYASVYARARGVAGLALLQSPPRVRRRVRASSARTRTPARAHTARPVMCPSAADRVTYRVTSAGRGAKSQAPQGFFVWVAFIFHKNVLLYSYEIDENIKKTGGMPEGGTPTERATKSAKKKASPTPSPHPHRV